jgi:hypothetical protein
MDRYQYFLHTVKRFSAGVFQNSVAEPEPDSEPQGAAAFGRSRTRNAMRVRLRHRPWYLTWLGIKK